MRRSLWSDTVTQLTRVKLVPSVPGMPPTRPSTAVIGAGISGLTASKMLGDYGVPYTCFESSDRVGGNWAFGNPNGHSSAYRSLHIDTSKHQLSFRDFPMPDDYPDFPHHTQIKDYLDSYADAFGLRDHIEFENGVVHAEPARRRRLGDHRPGRRRPGGSTCSSSPTATTGTRGCADFPGEFTGESIHSHHYIDPRTPLDLIGQADPRRRPRQQRRRHRRRAVAARRCSNEVTLSTRSSAWIVPKYMSGRPADKILPRPSRTSRCPGSARSSRWGQPMTGSDPTLYGLPDAQPQVLRGAPDPVGRAAAAARVRRRRRRRATSPGSTARPCTSRTAPAATST